MSKRRTETTLVRESLEARHPDLGLTDRQTDRVLQAAIGYARMGVADVGTSVDRAVTEALQSTILAGKRHRSKGVEERI